MSLKNFQSQPGKRVKPAKKPENFLHRELTEKEKLVVDKAVKKMVKEYGETLRLLGRCD